MGSQDQHQKQTTKNKGAEAETDAPQGAVDEQLNADVDETLDKIDEALGDMDDVLDELDDVLEEDAQAFVRGYIQKGGQ